MKKLTMILAPLALSAAAMSAAAEGLDGKTPMICAATSTVVCMQPGECVVGPPEAVNLPVFWHVDPVAKVAKSKRVGDAERSSNISDVSNSAGQLILHGADDGLGWSVSIDPSNGRMVLTGGRDVGYLVFGACTTP